MKRRLFALLLCLCLLLAQLPATAFAKGETGSGVTQTGSTLCEHHPQHDESCGYTEGTEGSPCTHEHDEDCYKLVTECVHEHTAECCPEESGCIMETLDCRHEHKGNVSEADREGGLGRDEACGYVPATEGTPCSFVCEICNVQDKDSETTTTPSDGQDIGTTATPSDAKPQECTCENLCTEDNINMDCPVCGTEDADLSECEGLEAMPATPSNALPAKALAAGQARETKKVEYIFYHRSPDDGKMTRVESSVEATVVESSMTEWEGTWYVVEGNMEFNSTITVTADARLILADGCKLTSRFEIFVNEGNSLTIYGQEEGTGELGVLGSRGHAAIGSEIGQDCGTITIHGDKITANVGGLSGSDGAGIGGGDGGDGGEITITGGTVTAAVGYFGGAGIGGGARSSSDTITITGGTVMATGGYSGGAGIGGGARGSSDTIDIYGGTVTATGGYSGGAGIGGSSYGGTITIHGGTVNASSSDSDGFNAVGIGGSGSSGGEITITGGTVTATSRGLLGFTGDGISGTFSTGEDGSAIIYASRIKAGSDPSQWSGIIFQGDSGQVYGDQTLTGDFTVKEDQTLAIPDGASLTVPDGVTLTNEGTIQITGSGVLTNQGTLDNSSGLVTIAGDDSVVNDGTIHRGSQTAPDPGEGYTIDYEEETLFIQDGYEVQDGNGTEIDSGSLSDYLGETFYIRKAACITQNASDWRELKIPTRPSDVSDAPQVIDWTDISITIAAEDGVEYRLGADGQWQTGTNGSLTFDGLTAGQTYTIYARYEAIASGDSPAFVSGNPVLRPPRKPLRGRPPR